MILLTRTEVLGSDDLVNEGVAESNPELLQRAME